MDEDQCWNQQREEEIWKDTMQLVLESHGGMQLGTLEELKLVTRVVLTCVLHDGCLAIAS